MGGFILALGLQRWNLHRCFALHVILMVGAKPKQMIAGFMLAAALLSMWISNTATAAIFLPIMGGVAVGLGLTEYGEQNVLLLVLSVVLCTTCSFILPVATPPNAIAFASGYVRIGDMLKGGFWLNVIALFLLTLTTYFIAVPVFDLVLP